MASGIEPHGYLRKVLARDEDILFLARRHGLFLFGRIFWWLMLALVIVVGVFFAYHASKDPAVTIWLGLLLLPAGFIWWDWLVWSTHMVVLTNRRVVQVTGVFGKEVVDSLLEKLNDVKTDQSLLGRMFDWGDVEILTANEVGNNVFARIARPLEFKQEMLSAKEQLEHGHGPTA